MALASACETLQRGQDSLAARHAIKGIERFVVAAAGVLDSARVFPVTVLGPDARIIEPGRNGMDVTRLAVVVLHHVAEAAMQNAGLGHT